MKSKFTSASMLPAGIIPNKQIVFGWTAFCLFLFIATSAYSQTFRLRRTWMVERAGALDRPQTMAVQSSGEHFAVVRKYEHSFEVFLYDRTTATVWTRPFPEEGDESTSNREPIAIAFSALDDGIFVLMREAFPVDPGESEYGIGRLIKYNMRGDIVFNRSIFTRDNHPEVLLAASNGDAVVAGWDMDPSTLSPSRMYVTRFRPSLPDPEVWSTGNIRIGEAITAPTAIAESPDRTSIYLTGAGSRFQSSRAASLELHRPNTMFTVALDAATGVKRWEQKVGEYVDPSDFNRSAHGYALQPLNDGVAVLGQHVLGTTGSTLLIKYNALDGEEAWRVTRESGWLHYPQLIRNNLAADVERNMLYMAYPLAESPNRAAVEKIRDDGTVGTRIWLRNTWPDADTEIRSINTSSISGGKIYVGARLGPPFDQNIMMVLSDVDNNLVASGVLRDGLEINQIEPFPHPEVPADTGVVFVSGGLGRITDRDSPPRTFVSTAGFVERYELTSLPSFPFPLETVDHFVSEIIDEHAWRLEAYCRDHPCADIAIITFAAQFDKEIWSKKIDKPTTISLSPSEIPTTYGIKFEVNKKFQEVITMDETLFAAGVKGVQIQTDAKDQSLTIKSTTEGKQIPFMLTLLNGQGKTIKQYNLTAPDEVVITDKQKEQVARLLLSAPDPFQVSVYPNPSSGEFTVATGAQKKSTTTVSILTINGHKVYHEQVASGEKLFVKIPSAKPGLYVLLIKSGAYERRQLIEIKY